MTREFLSSVAAAILSVAGSGIAIGKTDLVFSTEASSVLVSEQHLSARSRLPAAAETRAYRITDNGRTRRKSAGTRKFKARKKRQGVGNLKGKEPPRAGLLVPAIQKIREPPPRGCATPGNCWPDHKPKN